MTISTRRMTALMLGALAGFALMLLVLPPMVSADGGSTAFIHACVGPVPKGAVRIVGPNEPCKSAETPKHWPVKALYGVGPFSEFSDVDTTTPKILQVGCPVGTSPVSGGAQIFGPYDGPYGPYAPGVILQSSAPYASSAGGGGWFATAWAIHTDIAWGLGVNAFCGVIYYGASLMGPVRPLFAWASLALVAGLVVSQLVGWPRRRAKATKVQA